MMFTHIVSLVRRSPWSVDLFLGAQRTGDVRDRRDVCLCGHGGRSARSVQFHGRGIRREILYGAGNPCRSRRGRVDGDFRSPHRSDRCGGQTDRGANRYAGAFVPDGEHDQVSELQGYEVPGRPAHYLFGLGHFGLGTGGGLASSYAICYLCRVCPARSVRTNARNACKTCREAASVKEGAAGSRPEIVAAATRSSRGLARFSESWWMVQTSPCVTELASEPE